MRGNREICGCFPTGRHYPGIADRLAKARAAAPIKGLAKAFDPDTVWQSAAFAVIDFETTGLDAATERVVEMGVVCFRDGELESSHNWLINPTIPVPEGASAVHGITDEMLADKPTFKEVWSEIEPHLSDRLPVAYNAPFDKGFLLAELERMGRSTKSDDLPPAMQQSVEWIDPLVWVREFSEKGQSAKLGQVCQRLGIPLEGAHRAANDAEATGKVLLNYASEMPANYGELIRVQQRYAAQQKLDNSFWRRRRS